MAVISGRAVIAGGHVVRADSDVITSTKGYVEQVLVGVARRREQTRT